MFQAEEGNEQEGTFYSHYRTVVLPYMVVKIVF